MAWQRETETSPDVPAIHVLLGGKGVDTGLRRA
jgi:hypothetical protein